MYIHLYFLYTCICFIFIYTLQNLLHHMKMQRLKKNKEIGWLAALQLSSTFFSHVEAEMLKTLCFSHVSSLGCIFEASFCTAWAKSKFKKFLFVEAKLSFFPRWKKVWNLTFELTISMFSQSHAGQQLIFQLCRKHFGSSSKMEETMAALWRHGSFAPIANGFRLFLHKLCLSGQKRLASIFWILSMWSLIVGFLQQQSGCWTSFVFFSQIAVFCPRPLCIWTA